MASAAASFARISLTSLMASTAFSPEASAFSAACCAVAWGRGHFLPQAFVLRLVGGVGGVRRFH